MGISKRAVASLLAAVVVATAGAYYYLRRGPHAAGSSAPPELISLAPADATSLFYADLAALRSSSFLAQLMALAPAPQADPEYQEFVRATGFDYTRNLDRVLLAVRSGPPANFTVALAEGHFDRDRIARYALRTGKLERQNGVEVYVIPAGTPAKAVALAFLDANRIALADSPSLAPVLPARGHEFDAAMRERISRVAGAAVFAVGQVGPVPENFSLGDVRSDQFTNLVRSLRWFSLAARPEGSQMKVTIEGECDTAESARQIAGTLDGLRLLGQAVLADPRTQQKMLPQTASQLETLLRAAAVSQDNQRVRLAVELTSEMISALSSILTRSGPATSPPPR